MRRLDLTSLVAGLLLIAVGVILLLDRLGSLDIGFNALFPILAATIGAVLLAWGLDDERRG